MLCTDSLLMKTNMKAPVWSFFGFHRNPQNPDEIGNLDRPVCGCCREVVPVKLPIYTATLKNFHANVYKC